MATKPTKLDAMSLWTHEGRLSEAMRAAKLRVTPAAYAAANMDNCVMKDDAKVRLVRGVRVYAAGGADYARLWLDGDTLVVQFVAPRTGDDVATVAQYYRKVPRRAGWLEYRRPATRDPRPDLVAHIGSLLGQAAYERRQAKKKT